jgi:hypothetical protein
MSSTAPRRAGDPPLGDAHGGLRGPAGPREQAEVEVARGRAVRGANVAAPVQEDQVAQALHHDVLRGHWDARELLRVGQRRKQVVIVTTGEVGRSLS